MTIIVTRAQIKAVAAMLKRRFPNLTVEETIDLSYEILDAAGLADQLEPPK